ncbi:MAG: hypothetical protein U1C53_02870 [Candidatus Veblenbacteria bacterium]|nr:hypothetical protein [Candidatus Veblenbacteria bacterium]MDZ4230057.1 hypothetical protein [Candidatus Veblenbacteria bacterium]
MRRSVNTKVHPAVGFTTIELLVVVAIMLVVVSAAASIFLLVSRTQKRIIANQQVQGEVRFALESMVRDIHVGMVDYGYYQSIPLVDASGVIQPLQALALRDASNQPVLYRLNSLNQTLEVSRGQGGTWQPLLSDTVQVSMVRFYIVPAANPFVPCSGGSCATVPNEQPRVTVSLTAQNVPESGYPTASLWLQTTIVSRAYRR